MSKTKFRPKSQRMLSLVAAMLMASACASFPPPTNTVASSLASVRGAEEVGAEDVPQAALKLHLAREQIAEAKKLMDDGDHEEAHYMALRASNHAELAIVLVRESEARSKAINAAGRVDSAKKEMTP